MKKDCKTHLTHQLPIFINSDSRLLILGSFPSVKSREYGFYYSHPRNRFFLTLSSVFNEVCPITIDDRKEFLIKHHIALYDVIEECDINNSDDSSIRNVTPIDIKGILDRYPNIKAIGITGKKAHSLFDKYLKDKVSVKIIYLPSTSPANAKASNEELKDSFKALFD